ncbi:bifunctional hydroxymethylpyrimidine kinase/phosphomethylpyrimidine kinase [Thermomicrobium sp. 4228-Ro]|uniref:bifunctional hydroxymethylpyrimidine kinase/phosphomethylpyrimidine kinase n=1 Tax=Thermomicrobium sp. 4228-Ro TaxID=2993937 RepID=UPI003A4C7DE1
MSTRIPKALTIAGSDSGAGAGIQADLKTFSALGVYGSTVITAITAQNTLGVTAVHEIPTDIVAAQLDAVMEDIGADAAKTGMLSSAAIIETVADGVRRHRIERLVVDPVMVAKSGDRLLREDAVTALRETLLPLAFIVTPNAPEAEVLCGRPVRNEDEMREAARIIHSFGPRYVVVKGGHVEGGQVIDLLFDGTHFERFALPRVATPHTHGTGCTFSAAIAAFLARGFDVSTAVWEAKRYLHRALEAAFAIGRGRSPVHHFHAWWAPVPETQEVRDG